MQVIDRKIPTIAMRCIKFKIISPKNKITKEKIAIQLKGCILSKDLLKLNIFKGSS